MTTTAVSFRKGNTEENNNFAGVAGEIVADLGANEQVTENATIVLHTGNGTAGGIRMARQDLNNITVESISNLANFRQDSGQGTYYGLLRRNLSNYITNDVNATTVENALKSDYHIASQDGHDLDTSTYIAGETDWGNEGPVSRSFSTGKYLMNRDLSNIHKTGENAIRKLSYQYWLNNVDTQFLAEGFPDPYSTADPRPTIRPHGSLLAYANMSNVDTGVLAGDSGTHIGNDLAYKDLANVNYSNIVNKIDTAYGEGTKLTGYEDTANRTSTIDPLAPEQELTTKYPTAQAVINYSSSLTDGCANVHLDNIESWQIASEKQDLWKIEIGIADSGSDYTLPCTIRTNIQHPDGIGPIKIVVTRIDENGGILSAKPESGQEYTHGTIASQTINDNDPDWGLGAIFSLTTVNVNAGKLMRANLSNSDIENSTGTQTAAVKYEFTENSGAIETVDSVFMDLTDTSNQLSPTAGSVSINRELAGVESKLLVQDMTTPSSITSSSITVTKNNAYLNKIAATEAHDADHQLLNRGEMDARYQLQPASAATDNIATFNNALSTVDSGKAFTTSVANDTATASNNKVPTEKAVRDAIDVAITQAVVYKGTVDQEVADPTATPPKTGLPISGQTNGDLWWIRAFSNNPPAGMIAGHSGTAIWNGNLATPAWDFKEDNQNDPDGVSIGFDNGKLAVKISATADNAISIDSIGDGLYVSGNSFVPSSGYVAVAGPLGSSTVGKVLTNVYENNSYHTAWRTATPEPPTTRGIYHLSVDENGVATWVEDRRLVLGSVTE